MKTGGLKKVKEKRLRALLKNSRRIFKSKKIDARLPKESGAGALVIYGRCTKMADGVTGECIVADNSMMRNIMAFQTAVQE